MSDDSDNNNNTISNNSQCAPPRVSLVWGQYRAAARDDGRQQAKDLIHHRTIHLVEKPVEDDLPLSSSSASENEGDTGDIPDVVLQFEKKKRQAQHNKKVGLMPEQLDVIYHDDDIVVINKPPGVLTVPGLNQRGCVLDMVYEQFAKHDHDDDDEEPLIKEQMVAHRLDMDTSGLLIFGRTKSITKVLHKLFRDRQVQKEYIAAVMGHWPVDHCRAGRIDLTLQRDYANPPFMRVSTPQYRKDAEGALVHLRRAGWIRLMQKKPQLSQTDFEVLSLGTTPVHKLPYTLLRLSPVTGRMHQLRVHCAAAGFPIVGDSAYSLYGDAARSGGILNVDRLLLVDNGEQDPKTTETTAGSQKQNWVPVSCPSLELQQEWNKHYPPNVKPMCLHAFKLEFSHPTRQGEKMNFEVEPSYRSFLDEI
ncbi:hypothetical protein ACA910_014159 [Epithemia clementina (nom. ined.)]